jgi:hypothetical protein
MQDNLEIGKAGKAFEDPCVCGERGALLKDSRKLAQKSKESNDADFSPAPVPSSFPEKALI